MKNPYDVDPQQLIEETAAALEAEHDAVEMPQWAAFVKTGVHKERPPRQDNWWYIRSAAILRKIYLDGPLGTSRLRTIYGGKHRRGHQTEHFARGSGKVIRTILQQLEKAGLVADTDGDGRVITPAGQSFLDNLSLDVAEAAAEAVEA